MFSRVVPSVSWCRRSRWDEGKGKRGERSRGRLWPRDANLSQSMNWERTAWGRAREHTRAQFAQENGVFCNTFLCVCVCVESVQEKCGSGSTSWSQKSLTLWSRWGDRNTRSGCLLKGGGGTQYSAYPKRTYVYINPYMPADFCSIAACVLFSRWSYYSIASPTLRNCKIIFLWQILCVPVIEYSLTIDVSRCLFANPFFFWLAVRRRREARAKWEGAGSEDGKKNTVYCTELLLHEH